jgi:hypothetical protein
MTDTPFAKYGTAILADSQSVGQTVILGMLTELVTAATYSLRTSVGCPLGSGARPAL